MQRDPTETCVGVLTSALPEHLPNPDTSGGLLLVEVDDASAVSHLFGDNIILFLSPLSPMPYNLMLILQKILHMVHTFQRTCLVFHFSFS